MASSDTSSFREEVKKYTYIDFINDFSFEFKKYGIRIFDKWDEEEIYNNGEIVIYSPFVKKIQYYFFRSIVDNNQGNVPTNIEFWDKDENIREDVSNIILQPLIDNEIDLIKNTFEQQDSIIDKRLTYLTSKSLIKKIIGTYVACNLWNRYIKDKNSPFLIKTGEKLEDASVSLNKIIPNIDHNLFLFINNNPFAVELYNMLLKYIHPKRLMGKSSALDEVSLNYI